MNENHDVEHQGSDERLQEAVEKKEEQSSRLFGTFAGVFTPTLLTILGVIMYLRTGWVVGNAGLLGAWLIIVLSFAITTCTGLSLSSITTNIRIGAGGAFSVISQSLGLEVGGSVGVPLFLSQALAVCMYVFGFRAGWQWIFPDHPALLVDLLTFGMLFVIAFISAGFAFKIQYLIMAVIGVSLLSVLVAGVTGSMQEPVTWWGEFPGSPETGFEGIGFWAVFAVFFPASTGIMAGANMSGELRDARRSIPLGTLSAIGVSLVVYLAIAWWLARSATPSELTSNYTIMVDKAAWGPAILAGLLGATFSSALSSLVGAPRILQALGQHDILPRSKWLAKRTASGEPRNALLLTAAIVLAALMLRDLNAVAPLITMFFLVTYGMINAVVLLEQSIGLVSFRPLLRIPRIVPLVGGLGCVFAMFIINPLFSLAAVAVVLLIHGYLIRRHLKAPFGDVRSGLFAAVAEWAAKKMSELSTPKAKTWKANILLPVESPEAAEDLTPLAVGMAYPRGFLKLVGLASGSEANSLKSSLENHVERIREENVFASWTLLSAETFNTNIRAGIEVFGGTFLRPTVLLLQVPQGEGRDKQVLGTVANALGNDIGFVLTGGKPEFGADEIGTINVWFPNRGPDWDIEMDLGNQDLAILIGYKLKRNWDAKLRLIAVAGEKETDEAREFLTSFAELARIPNAKIEISTQDPRDAEKLPQAELNILPVAEQPDLGALREICERHGKSWLFTRDSGEESALV